MKVLTIAHASLEKDYIVPQEASGQSSKGRYKLGKSLFIE